MSCCLPERSKQETGPEGQQEKLVIRDNECMTLISIIVVYRSRIRGRSRGMREMKEEKIKRGGISF